MLNSSDFLVSHIIIQLFTAISLILLD